MTPNTFLQFSNIHWRIIREKLRVEITVRTVIAKDAMSTTVKLTMEIEESACGVIDYGVVLPDDVFPR